MSLTITPAEIVEKAEASRSPGLLAKAPEWGRIELGDVARVVNGAAFPSAGFNSEGRGMPLIRIRDVTQGKTQTWFDGTWEQQHVVRHGDVLVGMDGDFRVERWRGDDALLNQRVCRIDIDESKYDARFLWVVLQGYLDAIWQETSSVTVKHLSSRSIAAVPLPCPSLDEQRRIVDLLEDHLSRLDAAAAGITNAERRLRAFERSTLDRHFGCNAAVPLAELVDDISAGKSFGSTNAPARDSEWGIIKVSAMTWGEFKPAENKAVPADRVDPRFEIRPGDLLVSRANTADYVGASVLVRSVRPKLLLSDKSLRITPKEGVRAEWLWRALQAPSARHQIRALATGTKDSMRNVSQVSLRHVLLPDAPPSGQQRALVAFESVQAGRNRLRDEVSRSSERLAALRRSLLAAAFTGSLTREPPDLPDLAHERR